MAKKRKKKPDQRWLDALSPESTRPKQNFKLPQNNGATYVPNMDDSMKNFREQRKRLAANATIISMYRSLGRKQAQGETIEMVAHKLVDLMHLKINGEVTKLSVAKAIDPNFAQAKGKKPLEKNVVKKVYAATFVMDANTQGPPLPTNRPSGPTQTMIRAFYTSWEWKKLSYEIKLERGRVCECCGARPPKAVITTDHIKPIRRFWHLRFDRTNMQVLCDDCNRGKASHDETDFRSLNATESAYPIEPDMTPDEQARLDAIHDQLKLH